MPSYYFGGRPSRGFQAGIDGYVIVVGGGVRDPGGRVNAMSNKLEPVYVSVAQQLQEEAANQYRNKIIRKSISTGRLIRATLSTQNRHTSNSQMFVGRKEFLDQATRVGSTGSGGYHTLIEEGSQGTAYLGPMVDRSGVPLFGSWVPGNSPYKARTTHQTLLVYSASTRARIAERQPIPPQRETPIQGIWAYRAAWNKVQPVNEIRRQWRLKLQAEGFNIGARGPLPSSVPGGYRL